VARHVLGTTSDDCDSVRIGSSGLRIECPIAPGTQYVARKPGYADSQYELQIYGFAVHVNVD